MILGKAGTFFLVSCKVWNIPVGHVGVPTLSVIKYEYEHEYDNMNDYEYIIRNDYESLLTKNIIFLRFNL